MAVSTNFTDAAAYRAYVEEFADDLISRGYYSNRTASIATPHEGVKGKKTLTILSLGNLGRRWDAAFSPTADTLAFSPRELNVEPCRFELQFVPQSFEGNYLGAKRTRTFNDSNEVPFIGYIMNQVMAKQSQEIENAMWRGEEVTPNLSTHTLLQTVDGYLTIIADDQALGSPKLTPVATPGGAITQNNVVELIESMWDVLDPSYQDMPIAIFVNPKVWSLYQRAYRNDFSKYTDAMQTGRIKLDFCDGEIIRTPGMGTSSRILMTPAENLHYGFDGANDASTFNFEKDHRAMDYWSDFKMGVQIGLMEQGVVVINDLA